MYRADLAALVRIHTKLLGCVKKRVSRLPGAPETPMTESEIQTKMADCFSCGARPLSDTQRSSLIDKLARLDELPEITPLFWDL